MCLSDHCPAFYSCLLTITLHIVDVCLTCLINITYLLTYLCSSLNAVPSVIGRRYGTITSVRSLPDKFCAFINFKNKMAAARALVGLQVCTAPLGG